MYPNLAKVVLLCNYNHIKKQPYSLQLASINTHDCFAATDVSSVAEGQLLMGEISGYSARRNNGIMKIVNFDNTQQIQ